jgi:spore germination protein
LIASLVIVEGSPKELIEYSKDFKDKQRPSFYVNDLIDEAIKNSFTVDSKIYQFSILSHSRTIDPTATYIAYEKNGIVVLGSAVFDGDKMVGTINTKQASLLNSLLENKNTIHYLYNGTYAQRAQTNKKNGASIDMKLKKRKVRIKTDGDKVTIDIDLKFKGSVIEYLAPFDLSNPKHKKLFEDDVSRCISSDCSDLVSYLQEIGSDPVGFGEMMRAKHNQYWKSKSWKDEYKRAEINVNAKLDIEFFGAITNQ